jgi:hypothetical protein
MDTFRSILLVSLLMAAATNAFAADFPKAPANQKEAESNGLQRVNLEDLKKFIPGVVNNKGFKGGKHTLTFKPDGSVHRTGFGDKEQTGKWNIDEEKNAYCVSFQEKKGYKKTCFVVFRAKDGINYFDFDEGNGFYAHVWHPGD